MDFYTDTILGEWGAYKKGNTKDHLCFLRSAEVFLRPDEALRRIDPETKVAMKVHGRVRLTEKKLVSKKTSGASFFRSVDFMEGTIQVVE